MIRLSDAELTELRSLMVGETLHPDSVVKHAADPNSALHARFTWDNDRAAHLHRLEEARALIMRVRVQIQPRPTDPPIAVRAFVSLGNDRIAGGGYRTIEAVMSDPQLRSEMLRTALMELRVLQTRYQHLSELAQVFAELEAVGTQQLAAG
jgi:hypothetical protein